MDVVTATLTLRVIYTTWIHINTFTRDPCNLGIYAPKKVFRQTELLPFQPYYSVLPGQFSYTDQGRVEIDVGMVGARSQVPQINLGSVQIM